MKFPHWLRHDYGRWTLIKIRVRDGFPPYPGQPVETVEAQVRVCDVCGYRNVKEL